MPSPILVDTDVLIDYLRGLPAAVDFLENLTEPLLISSMTVAELYAGVREGEEKQVLDLFVQAFEVVPVDDEIAIRGGLFRRDYRASHGTGLADALLAATASRRGAQLVTLNARHYPMLSDLKVPYRKA
ncbi:MAG TPA: type II toxin-antitoxin system VapC family toxin [Thermoanaerobaculia bacterium]|nr:type II toxin-antitoxin system VapC family toxin [Thermoanaerobaculia bacterium]